MTRANLTKDVCQAIEMPRKESDVVVCIIFDSIARALQSGDKVEIRGFGSFRTRQRGARIGRNPITGARVEVPSKKIPFFKPSKEVRELIGTRQNPNRKGPANQIRTGPGLRNADPPDSPTLAPGRRSEPQFSPAGVRHPDRNRIGKHLPTYRSLSDVGSHLCTSGRQFARDPWSTSSDKALNGRAGRAAMGQMLRLRPPPFLG